MLFIGIYITTSCTTESSDNTRPQLEYDVIQATVSMDYSVGALATIHKEQNVLNENISSISGDPVLDFDGEFLWQLNRYRYDTLRKYDPADLTAPLAEISLRFESEESSNPQAVRRCSDKLFVSQHDKTELLILDPSTLSKLGSVSLEDFMDEDGSPEASTMVQLEDDALYVGLQRLNRNDSWNSVGSAIVKIDCIEEKIETEYMFGADIRLYQDEDTLLLSSSRAHEQSGGIFTLTQEQTFAPYVEIDKEVLDVAAIGEYLYFITIDDDFGQQEVYCASKENGSLTLLRDFDEYLTFIRSNGNSLWIGAHWGWNNPEEAKYGTHLWTVQGCSIDSEQYIQGELAPFDMVFID